jgi:hypothetical protein
LLNAENYYENDENQREFFINLAKTMGFDPLDPENWYTLALELILPHKVQKQTERRGRKAQDEERERKN